MGPVTQHLRALFPELPQTCAEETLHWTFDANLKSLGADFYNKILPLHPILMVEYSILCNQLRNDFLSPESTDKVLTTERLATALMFCELLEHVHRYYLVVPREVLRLRKQKQLFRSLLTDHAGYSYLAEASSAEEVEIGLSLAQQVRDLTVQTNWYRILINRSKRLLNLLNNVVNNSQAFNAFMADIDRYMNPFLAYLGFLFHLPRLIINLLIITKHTIPGSWMDEEEKSLAWTTRFLAQVQRRWFEMGNDIVWTVLGILSCFVLTGSLVAIAPYLTVAGFTFDVINATRRAYVELSRLYALQEDYEAMLEREENPLRQEEIRQYQSHINERIHFEQLRFSLHVTGTILIVAAMSVALPLLALNPILLLASAIFLLLLWGINYTLTRKLDDYRPKDTIEVPANVSKLGFFAEKNPSPKYEETPTPSIEIEGAEEAGPSFI